MTQYINKAAIIAEIERLREQDYPCDTFEESTGYYNALDEIASFINTLEVKEVDLEEEINEWLLRGNITDTRYDDYRDDDIIETAKHFFELGLKAQKE